ncbi:MAG: hypothetical protein ABI840_07225 [bacterium]
MKSKIILFILGFIFIASLNGCGLMSKKYTKTETVTHQISTDGKKKIKLDNINGSVTISQSKDSNFLMVKAHKEIKVKKKYLDTPFDEIEVILDTTGSIISVKTEINKKGEDGIFKFNIDRNQRVDYEISVPLNMEIEVENINGNITAGRLTDDLKIDLVNGEVSLENYTGLLECEITNGSFSGHIDSTRGMDINTINGSVTLYLNNYMNANVRAESVHGKITNEQLQFHETIKEKNLFKGKLGSGDSNVDIKIETVNGKIKLYGRNEI